MEERLIEFASILRRNGMRVSPSENMDAFRALELIGIEDPLLFRHTLRTTLVKRASDVKPFEELFDYFFLGIGQALDAIDRRIMEELGLSPERFQEMLEQIQRLLKEKQLIGYSYDGFWESMDTFKDRQHLESLAAAGQAPWEIWKKNGSKQ